MHEIVRAHQLEQQVDTLRAALGVKPDPRALGGRERAPQPEIGGPHAAKLAQGDVERRVGVAQGSRPRVLVVALERGPVLAQDLACAPRVHHLGVGQVLDDLNHRPFPRGFRSAERRVVDSSSAAIEPGELRGGDLERVPVAEEIEQGTHVGRSGRGGAAGGIGEGHWALRIKEPASRRRRSRTGSALPPRDDRPRAPTHARRRRSPT